jgi:hypothetical protein
VASPERRAIRLSIEEAADCVVRRFGAGLVRRMIGTRPPKATAIGGRLVYSSIDLDHWGEEAAQRLHDRGVPIFETFKARAEQ